MIKSYLNNIEYFLGSLKENNSVFLKSIGKNKIKTKKILEKVGVSVRNIADKKTFSNDLAFKSASKIIKQINRKKIDYLINCTQTPEYLIPTNACILQKKLKLNNNIGALDINLGCSGFIYLLSLAKGLISSKISKNILLITTDTYSKLIDPQDLSTKLIFSDAATTSLVSENKTTNSFEILNFEFGTDGSGSRDFICDDFGTKNLSNKFVKQPKINMNGTKIFEFTLNTIPSFISNFLYNNKIDKNKIKYFFFHQASKLVLDNIQKKLDLKDENMVNDLKSVGNTVSSSIPIILKKKFKNIKKNELILLCGFGVGLSWGACLLKKT